MISLETFELAGTAYAKPSGRRTWRDILEAARPERSCSFKTAVRWHRRLLCLAFPMAAAVQTQSREVSACAQCHKQARSQPATSMAHALEKVEESKILIDHPLLTATVGRYAYRIERNGNLSSYSVSDVVKTVTMLIRWVMGASSAIGQTYILGKDGEFYESRVSTSAN